MSILPKGWIETTLEDACEKISDGTHHSPKEQYDKPAKQQFSLWREGENVIRPFEAGMWTAIDGDDVSARL
jgi:hypothetical protein